MAELNKGADDKIDDLKEKYSGTSASVEAELAALKAGLNN